MKIGIPKEIHPGEARVAATPDTVKRLHKYGFSVIVETGAGEAANYPNELYEAAGCTVVASADLVWSQADLVLKVRPPAFNHSTGKHEVDLLPEGGKLISFIWPAENKDLLDRLTAKKATVLGMESIPRISRAQKMDALSSMANIAGYRAVIEAANCFGRVFTGQITAAGKMPPAKVLVIGAGVAGLAAIGAARSLGAIVRSFDTRPAVKEQVESMGAEFLMLDFKEDGTGEGGYAKVMSKEFIDAEMALFLEQAKEVDIIITTALIPGKKAPLLVNEEAVNAMKPGSVIVDLAAERGGNCAFTKADELVDHNGVTIIGYTDLPSRMAAQSSRLYGNNLCHLLDDMGRAENFKVDENDLVVRGALIVRDGELMWPPPKIADPSPPKPKTPPPEPAPIAPKKKKSGHGHGHGAPSGEGGLSPSMVLAALALVGIGLAGPPNEFLAHFTVFVLSVFVGYMVVWNVSAALHTPLMSVTNAISGIIVIGGLLQVSGDMMHPATILGAIAILVATINIAGGFLVTQRMLKMFRK